MPPDSNVSILQDDSKHHLKVTCDKQFIIRDENALFQCMGLRRPHEHEMQKIFGRELTEFLTNQVVIADPD